MILTLLRIGWLNLKRDRVAQALTFLLPILFFSIFATVFGNQKDSTQRVRVGVVDLDGSDYSSKLVKALEAEGSLRVQTTVEENKVNVPLDRERAEALIKKGTLPVIVVLPKGIGAERRFWNADGTSRAKVQILADVSDPIAPQMVQGLLQKVAFTAAPDSLMNEGIAMFEKYGGALTTEQKAATAAWKSQIASGTTPAASTAGAGFGMPTEIVNVLHPDQGMALTVSFYAAGTGVMFLLFSCSGAGGTLLDEEESGTLGRLLGSRAGTGGILMGKWLFITLVAIFQLTLMFTWGQVAFGLPLTSHLPGFFVMTVVTSAAAAGFGLVLATFCRSRAQLSGVSTIVILTMSAVGGSMFPRFLMTDTMRNIGLATFNAWALDGYLKVFWQEAPVVALWPQVLVLVTLTMVFLFGARMLARRWETI